MMRFGVNLLWVARREYLAGQKLVEHIHSDGVYHYIFVLKGEGEIRIGKESFSFAAGSLYLTAPDVPHSFGSSVKAPLVTVEMKFQISDEALDARIRTLPLHLDVHTGAAGALVWEIWREKELGNLNYQQMQAAQLWQLLCLLERRSAEAEAGDARDRETLAPALSYIEGHIDEQITLSALAQTVHLERVYFAKKFKRVMGVSPMEYVKSIRIEKAKERVAFSDMPITHIAQTLGFQTLQHFSAVFLRETGLSPRQYRRALKRE